ncbi:alpha/beta hydrolase [Okibacterium endophyticum]
MSHESPYAALLAPIPISRHTVDVLGTSTRYWAYGDENASRTIVAVHGFRGDHHGLEPVVAHLPRARIISPDLPGFGESSPFTRSAHTVQAYAAWLAAFVDAIGLRSAPVILGHSFGSIIVSAALADGLGAERGILVNPIAAPALSGPRGILTRLAVVYYQLGAKLPERLGFGLLRNRFIVRVMSVAMAKTKDRRLRRWIHGQHDAYFSAFASRTVVLEAFTASVSHDVSEFAREIAVPMLLIAADRDDITPVSAQHRLAGLFADARLDVLENVGHLIHYEMPQQAAASISRFLDSAAPADQS